LDVAPSLILCGRNKWHCQGVGHSFSLNERKMGIHVRHHISSTKGTADFHHITDHEGPEGGADA